MTKLHLVCLPHTKVSTEFCGCAYTNKARLFCKMMQHEYEIFCYAPEGPPVEGATLVPCLTEAERIATFGKDDPNRLPGWPTDEQFAKFNLNAIGVLKMMLEPNDLILLSACWSQLAIAQAFPGHLRCEPFIGMDGVIGGDVFGAYESHTHMAAAYQRNNVPNIRCFDTVIPPYYDPADFPIQNQNKGDYLLFLGRLVFRKGPHIAAQIADACGMPLVIAGAGATEHSSTRVWASGHVEVLGKDLIYVGPVGVEKRNELIAGAVAMLVPTTYREPGGNVAIEAMACGTPPVCSDFGCFTEYVPKQFLFRTLREAVAAVEKAKAMPQFSFPIEDVLTHKKLQRYALENFSLAATAPKFKHWFESLASLRRTGWYDLD
jgi:glycosyltransferase involved in cell wall biosynthesis